MRSFLKKNMAAMLDPGGLKKNRWQFNEDLPVSCSLFAGGTSVPAHISPG